MRNAWFSCLNAVIIILSITDISASNNLEGSWQNQVHQLLITIQSTEVGIRVRRNDQSRWYEYDEIRDGQFQDLEGNTYMVISDNRIVWEDRYGKKRVLFSRLQENIRPSGNDLRDSGHYRGRNGKSTRIQRNHYYGSRRSPFVSTKALDGSWINPSTGQGVTIRSRKDRIKVRAHRGGWINFYRKDRNTFVDQNGNRYDASRNELTYTSRNGDFRMRFVRQ